MHSRDFWKVSVSSSRRSWRSGWERLCRDLCHLERTVAFRAGNRINTKVGVMKLNHKLRRGLAASVAVEAEKCHVISTSF